MKFSRIYLLIAILLASVNPHIASSKVAVVVARSLPPYMKAYEGLKKSSKLTLEYYNMEGEADKGAKIMKGFSKNHINAVVCIGSESMLAAKQLNKNIPIVYTMVLDPIPYSSHQSSGVIIKISVDDQFLRIKNMFPNKNRIGVIYNPQNSSHDISKARQASAKFSLRLNPIAVDERKQIPEALAKLTNNQVDIIWTVVDRTVGNQDAMEQQIAHAKAQKLPLIGLSVHDVYAGAFACFYTDFKDIGAQTADHLQSVIIKKVKNKVETPRKIVVYINSKVQKELEIDNFNSSSEMKFMR